MELNKSLDSNKSSSEMSKSMKSLKSASDLKNISPDLKVRETGTSRKLSNDFVDLSIFCFDWILCRNDSGSEHCFINVFCSVFLDITTFYRL
jgi:hypothetical protein